MPNHEKSWMRWLTTIGAPGKPPLELSEGHFNGVRIPVCSNCGCPEDRCDCLCPPSAESLSQALSIAAPWGPGGFVCEDEDCDGRNCVTKRKYKLDTRVANLEAVIRMLLSSRNPMEYSSSEQQAAARTATFFLENKE